MVIGWGIVGPKALESVALNQKVANKLANTQKKLRHSTLYLGDPDHRLCAQRPHSVQFSPMHSGIQAPTGRSNQPAKCMSCTVARRVLGRY